MRLSQITKHGLDTGPKWSRSYLHLSTPGVTYSAIGFCSLNTRRPVSISPALSQYQAYENHHPTAHSRSLA